MCFSTTKGKNQKEILQTEQSVPKFVVQFSSFSPPAYRQSESTVPEFSALAALLRSVPNPPTS